MKKKLFILTAIMLAPLTACTLTPSSNNNNGGNNGGGNNNGGNVNPPYDDSDVFITNRAYTDNYDNFYNPSNTIKLKIELTNAHANRVSEYGQYNDPRNDIYHPCKLTVTINGVDQVFEEVGIRRKGNMSRQTTDNFFDNGYINNSGRLCNFKLSFNQQFDDNEYYTPSTDLTVLKKRRFGGAKKFDIEANLNQDRYYMKEAYANYMLENEGLLSSKENFAEVTFKTESDEKTYIYSVQECIDEEFIKRRFNPTHANGNLYKGSWSNQSINGQYRNVSLNYLNDALFGIDDAATGKHFVYDLKTNKKRLDHTVIKNLITELKANDSGKTQEQLKAKFESLVAKDYFLKMAAIEYLMGNPDSMRNNYNNTFLYFDSATNLLYPIMFDNDRCFGVTRGYDVNTWSSWPDTGSALGQSATQLNPLYIRTICSRLNSSQYPTVMEYKNQYIAYVEEYANKYLSESKFNEFRARFATQQDDIGENGNTSFATFASGIKAQIADYKANN